MYKTSGSHFFRTTTRIQSRFIMTFLTILGVTERLCSFRLVLEGAIHKEVPKPSRSGFLEKFSTNNFALADAELSCCKQSWNMVKHVCINVNHSIIWWLTIWKPCHHHDITMEYRSIVRLNETSCRSWYHLITWYHGPTWHHLYMCKHG